MGNTSTKPSKTHPTSLPPKKNGMFSSWENRFQARQNDQMHETLQEARKRRKQKEAERNGLLMEGGFHLVDAGAGLGQLLSTSSDPSGGGGHSAGASACGGGSSGGGGGGGHSSSGGGSGCGGGGGGGGGC
ncbi:hypothetical protein V865_002961 [Kwoniella europaea PYCC6329]|uniref:Uncharacterized protein n=1 Tax=Kwoniella europaea PYCC6329 TaxID=1423913 RepID=A0AAX4KH53_9TREE